MKADLAATSRTLKSTNEGKVQLLWGLTIAVWIAAIFFIPPQWDAVPVISGITIHDAMVLAMLFVVSILVWIKLPTEWNWWFLVQQLIASLAVILDCLHHGRLLQIAILFFVINLAIMDVVIFSRGRVGATR